MIVRDLSRLTISRGRGEEIAAACAILALLGLLAVFGPRLPANHIFTWNILDSILGVVIGGPLCVFWIASAKSYTLTLAGPANRATYKASSLTVEMSDACDLTEITEIRIETTRKSYDNSFMFEIMHFVLRRGRLMPASQKSWKNGGHDEAARACAEFLGPGVKVTRVDAAH